MSNKNLLLLISIGLLTIALSQLVSPYIQLNDFLNAISPV